jgi:hypothetical protein
MQDNRDVSPESRKRHLPELCERLDLVVRPPELLLTPRKEFRTTCGGQPLLRRQTSNASDSYSAALIPGDTTLLKMGLK